MGERAGAGRDGDPSFLAFYDEALPYVFGYVSRRCGPRSLAEDLTAETFLAAVDASRGAGGASLGLPWVIGIARHKLVDHWRRQEREQRRHLQLEAEWAPATEDPWDARLDAVRCGQILEGLAAPHRAALTLRYLDDLPVADVAALLERSLHATEALLVRARVAFRHAYTDGDAHDA